MELAEPDDAPSLLRLAICCAVSVVCLVALLAAFCITEETKFLHGKSIVCQSICLTIAFIGLFINAMSLVPTGTALCYITGDQIFCILKSDLFYNHCRFQIFHYPNF
jgi:hypothetical protein